jgi:hypothetical protein
MEKLIRTVVAGRMVDVRDRDPNDPELAYHLKEGIFYEEWNG